MRALALHADGRRAVSASSDATLCLWDVERGAALGTFEGHGASVYAVACHPDDDRIVSGSSDETVRVWQIGQRACVATLDHGAAVRAVAIHPDGRKLATLTLDETLRVWDLKGGSCLFTLHRAEGEEDGEPGGVRRRRAGTSIVMEFDGLGRLVNVDGTWLPLGPVAILPDAKGPSPAGGTAPSRSALSPAEPSFAVSKGIRHRRALSPWSPRAAWRCPEAATAPCAYGIWPADAA
ncbi:MAG: hypothetical protein HYY06_30720 [Deltaproteobacteria bacterium]|nr:hypothetical protein [Deltaproteobacteria bacterium]